METTANEYERALSRYAQQEAPETTLGEQNEGYPRNPYGAQMEGSNEGRSRDMYGAQVGEPDEGNACDPCDAYPDTELDEDNCATHNSELGKRGEDAAVRYLEARGYEILERNWKCCAGEADIIAFDEDDLVFIEVKTRSNIKLGLPAEAVDAKKRERYEKIAALYLRDFERYDIPVRFDVIGILVTRRDRAMLRHHVNAFSQGC